MSETPPPPDPVSPEAIAARRNKKANRLVAGTALLTILGGAAVATQTQEYKDWAGEHGLPFGKKPDTSSSAEQFERNIAIAKKNGTITSIPAETIPVSQQIEKKLEKTLGTNLVIPEEDLNRLTRITAGLNPGKDIEKMESYSALSPDASLIPLALAGLPNQELPTNRLPQDTKEQMTDTAKLVEGLKGKSFNPEKDQAAAAEVIELINSFDPKKQLPTITEALKKELAEEFKDTSPEKDTALGPWQIAKPLGDNKNVWGAIEKAIEDKIPTPTAGQVNIGWRLTQAINKPGYDFRHMDQKSEYQSWDEGIYLTLAQVATLQPQQIEKLPKDMQKLVKPLVALNQSDPQSSPQKIQTENQAALTALQAGLEQFEPVDIVNEIKAVSVQTPDNPQDKAQEDNHRQHKDQTVHLPKDIDPQAIKKAENLGILAEITFTHADKTMWDKATADLQKATGQAQIAPGMVNPVSRINEGFNAINPHKMHDGDKYIGLTPEASVAVAALANLPLEKMDMLPPQGIALIKQIQALNHSPEHNTHSQAENLQAAQTIVMFTEMFPDPQKFADLQKLLKEQHVDLKKVQEIFQDAIKEMPPQLLEKIPTAMLSDGTTSHQGESSLVQTSFAEQLSDSGNDNEVDASSAEVTNADYEPEENHIRNELAQIRTDYYYPTNESHQQTDADHTSDTKADFVPEQKDIDALAAGGVGVGLAGLRRGRLKRLLHTAKEKLARIFKRKSRKQTPM